MNIKFAPCNFCERKPGFYSNGFNYCWVHWYSKSIELKKREKLYLELKNFCKNIILKKKYLILIKIGYLEEIGKIIISYL